jgi:hypothetical protein
MSLFATTTPGGVPCDPITSADWNFYASTNSSARFFINSYFSPIDLLCGLVVRVPGCRSRDPGSTDGTTRFSEK